MTAMIIVLLLALLPAVSGCGSTTGQTNATIYGLGHEKMSEKAKLADNAIAAIAKSTDVGTPVTITDGVLTVGCDTAYPPLEFLAKVTTRQNNEESTTIQMVGLEIDLCYAIANKFGLKVEFVSLDWTDLTTALTDGKIDMVASGASTGSALKGQAAPTDTYLAADLAICTKKTATLADQSALKGKIVGVQLGSTAETLTKTVEGVAELRPYPHILSAFADLRAGKLDAVVIEEPVWLWLSANNTDYANDLASGGTIESTEGYAFWCDSDNQQLLVAMNAALAELRQEQVVIQSTTTTTAGATTTTAGATTTLAPTVTAPGAATTTTVVALPTKSVYQLICDKWGLTAL